MTNLTCEKSADNRITLLEAIVTLQMKLQDARDEIHKLRRDGQDALDTAESTAAMWQQRHESMARLAGWLLASVCLMVVVAILGWTR